ncbi:ion channel [Hasllibacter halocynthiae]|uniref:Ion channel n=1 Tax=Hasllibacter halocynthiae TaxID=595589 RepID=A0A2T0X6J0_9RHOB|nr:ion channel [Hasllibacter halocynthiae]PRY94571.1 ion channel [Hasllibacter halocynthiae]
MPIVYGLAVLALLGLSHYYALLLLARVLGIDEAGERSDGTRRLVLLTFLGLAATHMAQIAALALAFLLGEEFLWSHEVIAAQADGWWDYHYLAFMTFTTLGYGPQVIEGPIRIVVGASALGGFMLITWSATFLYDVSRKVTDFGLESDDDAEEDRNREPRARARQA